jgi:hypothetical protein
MRRFGAFVVLVVVLGALSAVAANASNSTSVIGFFFGVDPTHEHCDGLLLVDGEGGPVAHLFAGQAKLTPMATGGAIFQCQADLISPAPTEALAITDAPIHVGCFGPDFALAIADSWSLVITPTGKLMFTCRAAAP